MYACVRVCLYDHIHMQNKALPVVMASCFYLRGKFAETCSFDAARSQAATFYSVSNAGKRSPSSSSPCVMMQRSGDFQYYEDASFQCVDLPFGSKQFSMLVLLPKESNESSNHRTQENKNVNGDRIVNEG